jgi:hypothetical protein
VANLEGDGWLTGGRWVANLEGDGWLNGARWVAKFAAHLLARAALWFEYRHSHKYKLSDIKQRSGQHTFACKKYIYLRILNTPATKHNILTIPGQPLTSPSDLCSTDLKIQ